VGGSLPTFPSRTPSKRLDDVFVSPDLEPLTKSSLDVEVSDHLPLVLEFRRKVL
jgi:endonuclease/exonuclease/phosphatase family metal-dependent hydrolase